MPTFDTSGPISATVDVVSGDVRISAGERAVAIVDVVPADPDRDHDRKAAEQTRVEYADGKLLVRTPKLRSWLPRSDGGAVNVTIELPAGSDLHGVSGLADFTCEGPFGNVRIKTGMGRIAVQRATTANLQTGLGDITLDQATGHVDVRAGSGEVRVGELAGSAVIKNSNGDTWVGVASGDLRVNAANGDIAVDLSQATVGAKSSNGDVRLGQVASGSVVLESKLGDLEVGIPEGRAAWLDVRAGAGRVHNSLAMAEGPEGAVEKVEVRARTTAGDIVVRRR
jgi:putative adhesin